MANAPEDVTAVVSELREENDKLKTLVRQCEASVEGHAQEAHSLRAQVKLLTAMQSDYQAEIESLLEAKTKLESGHQLQRDNHSSEMVELKKKVESLELLLSEEQESHALELSELKQTAKKAESSDEAELISSLRAELQEALNVQADIRQACQQHQELYQIVLKEKNDLQNELQNVKEMYDVTQEKLNIVKTDFKDQAEALEELRESLAATQNELASLKSQPSGSNDARGNSLFAEVEDHRQAAVKHYSSLKSKYIQMKRDYSAKCNEIVKLKLEKVRLSQQLEEELEERDQAEVWLTDNFEVRLQELQELVTSLKREEKPVFINGDTRILKYADHCVEESRKKINELQAEMEHRSVQRLDEAKALYATRSELRSLKARVVRLETENQFLRERLEQANITDIPPPAKLFKIDGPSSFLGKRNSLSQLVTENPQESIKTDLNIVAGSSNSRKSDIQSVALTSDEPPESRVNTVQHSEESSKQYEISDSKLINPKSEDSLSSNSTLKCDAKEGSGALSSVLSSPDGCEAAFKASENSYSNISETIHDKLGSLTLEVSRKSEHNPAIKNQYEKDENVSEENLGQIDCKDVSSFQENVHSVPQKSILMNSSFRSCLKNVGNSRLERKVCFSERDPEKSAPSALSAEEKMSKPDNVVKKKLLRHAPPVNYRTNFIVSKENVNP